MLPSLLLLIACGGSEPAEPAPVPEPQVATPPAAKDLHAHMEEHFAALSSARNAVVAGDLEAARERLGWLATHEPTEELPAAWTVFVSAMRAAAKRSSEAEGAEALARGVAHVASECGSCHESMGKGPLFTEQPSAAEGNTTRDHMIRHNEASEQMWQGLIGGDDARWLAGANALSDTEPLRELKHPTDKGIPEVSRALGVKVHELGLEGLGTMDRVARANLYGELIGTCALCHAVENVPPG